MIEFQTGDVLKVKAEALVNTVNCVGVMGKGVALHFKKKFPDNYKFYTNACSQKDVQLGRMLVFERRTMFNPLYIINFPTKRHWKNKSFMENIEAGLIDLVRVIKDRNIDSIALPALGCGLGGLDWNNVKHLVQRILSPLNDVKITVFEPR